MPHFVMEMFDQIDDLLTEYAPPTPAERTVTWEMKRHYLNMGQYAMWPRIYRTEQDTVDVEEETREYPFPDSIAGGRLVFLEGSTGENPTRYSMLPDDWYDIVPGVGGVDVIKWRGDPTDALIGGAMRITCTLPLVPIAAADETEAAAEEFSGPDYSVEGPALYAMNRITARGLHSRLDYGLQSVDFNNRSAIPNELMASSVFWLDEFERRVDQWQLVHPQSVR